MILYNIVMRKNIHPKLYEIIVTDSNNNEEKMFSTKEGNVILNTCKEQHPAWTGIQVIFSDNSKKLERFNRFF